MSLLTASGPLGISEYHFENNPVAAIQYRAGNIVLNELSFKNFNNPGPAIKVYGGENRADFINVRNVAADERFDKVFEIGPDIVEITIEHQRKEKVKI